MTLDTILIPVMMVLALLLGVLIAQPTKPKFVSCEPYAEYAIGEHPIACIKAFVLKNEDEYYKFISREE